MKVFYVQRLQKPLGKSNPFSFGGGLKNGGLSDEIMGILNPIFSFDYMGSAEFEFGALARAFYALSQAKLIKYTVEKQGKAIYVISPKEIKDDVIEWINICESQDLKESLDLDLKSENPDTLGWIKIENESYCKEPFMFFINEEMFNKTCNIFFNNN